MNTTHSAQFARLVRLARLAGAKISDASSTEDVRDAMETIVDRGGSGATPFLTETLEGLSALIEAKDAERDAANPRLRADARARYAATAAALRERIDGILYERELRLDNQRTQIVISETDVVYAFGTPTRLVDEELSKAGKRCDHAQRVGTADESGCGISTFRAPLV